MNRHYDINHYTELVDFNDELITQERCHSCDSVVALNDTHCLWCGACLYHDGEDDIDEDCDMDHSEDADEDLDELCFED